MARTWEPLVPRHLPSLLAPCGRCVSWQADPLVARRPAPGTADAERLKAEWVGRVVDEFGSAGLVLLEDGVVVGHVVHAPGVAVPRAEGLPTAPVSADAALLVGIAAVRPGLYKTLVQRTVKELREVNVRALEAFGGGRAPRGCLGAPPVDGGPCRLPNALLERVGFRVVREHPTSPRYRLEMSAAVPILAHLGREAADVVRTLRPVRAAEPGLGRSEPEGG